MTRPRLLDLFCGAGGAAMGYHRAGFDVVGVDHNPQPRYPFEFHQADAMSFPLDGFDAIHASPPCQAYSAGTANLRAAGKTYPDLLAATRERLAAQAAPWVIENVPGAPMRCDVMLCGSMFRLPGLIRHRWFELSTGPPALLLPTCNHIGLQDIDVPARVGKRRHASPSARVPARRIVSVVGSGVASGCRWWKHDRPKGVTWNELCKQALGIDWMSRAELSQAIPPAYTELIGGLLIDTLERAR